MTPTVAPPQHARGARADPVLVGIEATPVAVAVVVGAVLNHRHVPIQRRLLRSPR
jgi:hypothetical protein